MKPRKGFRGTLAEQNQKFDSASLETQKLLTLRPCQRSYNEQSARQLPRAWREVCECFAGTRDIKDKRISTQTLAASRRQTEPTYLWMSMLVT